jgi:hypothetical protein
VPEGESTDTDWDELLAQLGQPSADEGWVTLDEASAASGVARATLRSWYRKGSVQSRMAAGTYGPQRLVLLTEVLDRVGQSRRLSRQLDHARSLEAEVAELRLRVAALELWRVRLGSASQRD